MTLALAIDSRPHPLVELLDRAFEAPALDDLLELGEQRVPRELWQAALHGPLREFLARPGKEFRAELVAAAWTLAGSKQPMPERLPLLVEILHAGSLVIDDIEDASAYRRGAPALHVQHGVPLALNAGNWLYFFAEHALEQLALPPLVELRLRRLMTRTLVRSHHGQALDIAVRISELAQRDVQAVVSATTQLKTGALMGLAASLGAIAGGAAPERERAIVHFARELGVGLQMLDDLGGLVSERRCHKGHEDLILGRPTWPWAWAAKDLDAARFDALLALSREVQARSTHPEHLAEALRDAVALRGKQRVHAHLKSAFQELSQAVGSSPVLGRIRHELDRLEKSYE